MSKGGLGYLTEWTEDIWKVTETDEIWSKRWLRYARDGSEVGATIIVVNGSVELIDAIKRAFDETEGRKAR